MNLAVAIFTKNEERNIEDCINSFQGFGDIFVIDSQSSDKTCEIALSLGVNVIQFYWNGSYPRKKQWTLEQLSRYPKIIMIDADLRGNEKLKSEVSKLTEKKYAAALCPIEYHFMGSKIRFGIKVKYHAILDPNLCRFPDLEPKGDGYGDIEFHYQPDINGRKIRLSNPIIHNDSDSLDSWIQRHEQYAGYQSRLDALPHYSSTLNRGKTRLGYLFSKFPFKATTRFIVSYFLMFGFLDGKQGFRYQWWISQHYYLAKLYYLDKTK